MVIHPNITAWAVRSREGIALKLDRAAADLYATRMHGEVVELSSANELAHRIAIEKITEDLETYAAEVRIDGARWWDTRPMLDAREQPQECIDMAVLALDYAVSSGLLEQHPAMPHVVRMVR